MVLTLDGVGEWATTSVAIGRGNTMETVREIAFPHSLGLLYSAFTYYTGFRVNSGEYKVMGLAPYGEPKYADKILDTLMDVKPDGSFWLDQRYFNYATGLTMTNRRFDELFGGPPRQAEAPLTQREMDLAASVQAVTEEILLRMTRDLHKTYGIDNLCLAGGVALNCVANGKILRDGAFKNLFIQPAAGDAGGALGAALAAYHQHVKAPRVVDPARDLMQGSYLGPEFAQGDIEARPHQGRRPLRGRGQRQRDVRQDRRCARRRPRGRLVPGPHGVRPARARRPLDPRRSAQPGDAEDAEPQDQVPRELPPVRAVGPARGRRRLFRTRRSSPYMLLVADVKRNRRRHLTDEQASCSASTGSTCRSRISRRSPTSISRRACRPWRRATTPATTA